MTEREPQPGEQPPKEPAAEEQSAAIGSNEAGGPWDPQEQVGDIYRADINDEGQIESAERLTNKGGEDDGGKEQPEGEPARIYVASLADYNNGKYHGRWIDAMLEPDEIREKIAELLAASPELQREGERYGDWAIHDYEGFGALRLGELEDIEYVHAVAAGIQRHGEAFAAWVETQDSGDNDELAQLEARFSEAYLGEYDSLPAYGEVVAEEFGWPELIGQVLPESVARYVSIDSEALAQDMWLGGDIYVMHKPDGGVWIFRADL